MINENKYYNKLAEKYLNRFFQENEKRNRTVNVFHKEIISQAAKEKNYLHAHPWVFHWGVTSECNLRCKHCYYSDNASKYYSNNDLSSNEAMNLIEALGHLNICHVKVSGGEPFLRKDILEILKKLKSKNFSLAIQTNATLIDKNLAKEIAEILVPKVDIVQVSIDGANKDTHELTRGKNTFDKTINGIKNLVENDIYVQSSSIMTALNTHEFPALYKMLSNIGVKSFSVGRLKVCNDNQEALVPDFKLKLKILNKLIDMETIDLPLELSATKIYDFVNNEIGLEFLKEISKTNPLDFKGKNIICHQHNKLFMTGNGKVYLCDPTVTDEFCLGNVKTKTLKAIWDNRFNNLFFEEKMYDTFPCKKCEYFFLCKAGCPMTAYIKYKTVNAPDASCLYGEKLMKLGRTNSEIIQANSK